MTPSKIVGFRPPDEEFCRRFNLGMQATGADITTLCILAIRLGLDAAVHALTESRREAEQRYLQETGPEYKTGRSAKPK